MRVSGARFTARSGARISMTTTRRHLVIVIPSLVLLELTGCGSGVPPRSPALDPSDANGPESPPFSGSPALDESPIVADGESVQGDASNAENAPRAAQAGWRVRSG